MALLGELPSPTVKAMDGRAVVNEGSPLASDPERIRKIRWRVGLALALIIACSVAIVVTGGEYLLLFGAILIPGTLSAIRVLLHPERVGRTSEGDVAASIIENGGLDLTDLVDATSPSEARLALLDALDAVRQQGGSKRLSFWGRLAAGVGSLGWFVGAAAAWLLERDVASVVVCSVAGGLFGALGWYISRGAEQQRLATGILEGQLMAIEPVTHGSLGPGPGSGMSGKGSG